MPKHIKFTQAAVDNLKPPSTGRVTYWDSTLPGFGLRVAAPRPSSREGRKSWIAMGRVDGKAVMVTLGTLAQIPKVDKAREAARDAFAKMKAGTRPLDERRAAEQERKAAEAAAASATKEATDGQFAAVAARFLAEHVDRNCGPKYAREYRRIIAHDVLPRWGDRPIRGITKHDVNELLDAKASRRERPLKGRTGGAAVQSNRTLTRLRTLFAWAAAQGFVDADPTAGVLSRAKERPRDRVLSDDEIRLFWDCAARAGWPFSGILQLMLLTAQRETEVAGMAWDEINLAARTWTIPGRRAKNGKAHVVHLSEAAVEVIEALPRVGSSALVFPSRNGTTVSTFGRAKTRIDSAMAAEAGSEIAPWVLHDLRRTATTVMARLGIAPHVADKVLNHSSGTIRGVAAIYNQHQYLDERKAALEALGRFVASLVRPGGAGNVVELAVARVS
jgi:integrase